MRSLREYTLLGLLLSGLFSHYVYGDGIGTEIGEDDDDAKGKPHPLLNKVQPFGFQSTASNGNDFAASIVSSPNVKQGYFMTGTTSGFLLQSDNTKIHAGMHCYAMQMKPFMDEWTWLKKFGASRDDNPTTTTCTSVKTLFMSDDAKTTHVMISGYTEGDILFNPQDGNLKFSEEAASNNPEYAENKINGFVMLLSVPHMYEEKKAVNPTDIKVLSGKMLSENKVTYPISMTAVSDTDVVVISQISDVSSINAEAGLKDALGKTGDFEPVMKYGQFFQVLVERLSWDPDTNKMVKLWSETFDTDDRRGAHVSSIIYDDFEDRVIFAGTTHGTGKAFGHMNDVLSNGSDLDGYITILEADTGKFVKSERIQSNPGLDDIISGMCKKENGAALYIVGSTNAIMDDQFDSSYKVASGDRKLNAFVQKINLTSMKTLWKRQIGPVNINNDVSIDDQDVEGFGCAVDETEALVYITGSVSEGASVVEGQPGTGGTDAFIAAFQSTQGIYVDSFPTRQVGSVMDEHIAKDNGGITTDQYGNAVVYGTTKGNLISEKPPQLTQFSPIFSDIYFMSFLAEDAEHVSTIEVGTKNGVESSAKIPKTKRTGLTNYEMVGISLFISITVIVVFLLAYNYGKRRTVNHLEHQTDQDIARYLEEFEGAEKKKGNTDTQMYDISSYYGKNGNTAGANAGTASNIVPNEVSLPGGSPPAGDANKGGTTYDELMESYKNIMATTDEVSSAGASKPTSGQAANEDADNELL